MSTANGSIGAPSGDRAVDELHPWLGLASFSEETRRFFYGREEEIGELSRRVQRKLLTVLFGQSGLGKTSILRAGIVPRLREQGYCPVYVRIDYGPDAPAPAQQIRQAITDATAEAGNTVAAPPRDDESLWEFMHHRDKVISDGQGRPLIPLLIVDQFEEIFTLAQGDAGGRERANRFVESLAELVENRPSRELEAKLDEDETAFERYDFARADYRVLITLREDYLAHLEGLKAEMPSITQNRMRLAPMTGQQALAAVTGPGGALVSSEVAEAIVRFVAGGAELAHAQVEPSLLSLICRELNDKRIAAGRREISLDLLAGSHASILTDFYERALADQPEAVRGVIEDVLLTDSGYRENVAEERVLRALSGAGATPDTLAMLVDRRLLRIEDRLDVRRVELTHDVLCSVVAASRSQRQEREALAAAARERLAQGEREQATRRELARSRRITAFSLTLASLAVVSAVFGYVKLRESRETRAIAEATRGDAEKLVGFLLEDFHAELEPVGRLDMIGDLASRTVSYYRSLAPSMRTADTEANRGRALLRLGDVQRAQGRLGESAATLDDSVSALRSLVKQPGASEAVKLTLAEAMYSRGLVAYAAGDQSLAKQLIGDAAAIAKPFLLPGDAARRARRVYATALTRVGYMKMRDLDHAPAKADMRAALAALRAGGPVERDMRTAVVYSDTAAWLQEELSRFERDYAGAERVAEDALGVARSVLAKRPNHVVAMRITERVLFNRAVAAEARGRHAEALAALAQANAMNAAMLRIEPGNQQTIDTKSIKRGAAAESLFALGRPDEAARTSDEGLALYAARAPSAYQSGNLMGNAAFRAYIHAELGETRGRELRLEEMRRHIASSRLTRAASDRRAGVILYGELSALRARLVASEPLATLEIAADLTRRARDLFDRSGGKAGFHYLLVSAHQLEARIAYANGDYHRAEASSRAALSVARKLEETSMLAELRSAHGLALARLRRSAEARTVLMAAIDEQRALIDSGSDSQLLRLQLAQSLYALAWTQADGRKDALKEAAALIDAMPPAMQRYNTVRLWRDRILKGVG